MAPMALTLGLTAALQESMTGLPVRKQVADVMVTKDALQDGALYVGRGSFHHRLSTTNWKSVWASGHNCCDAGEWLAKYIIHIRTSNLWDALPELAYKTLACDCGLQDHCLWLCHGPDVRGGPPHRALL